MLTYNIENANLEIEDITETIDISGNYDFTPEWNNKKKQNTLNDKDECDFLILYMNKWYNNDDSIPYLKQLKKRITEFKKEVYSKLTAEDKCFIKLLDKYTQKIIHQSIKDTIDEFKDIHKNKSKSKLK